MHAANAANGMKDDWLFDDTYVCMAMINAPGEELMMTPSFSSLVGDFASGANRDLCHVSYLLPYGIALLSRTARAHSLIITFATKPLRSVNKERLSKFPVFVAAPNTRTIVSRGSSRVVDAKIDACQSHFALTYQHPNKILMQTSKSP
jgi:hypothetical protein